LSKTLEGKLKKCGFLTTYVICDQRHPEDNEEKLRRKAKKPKKYAGQLQYSFDNIDRQN
jgi:hypothetical protein